ncbi:tyrosine-type recombinase/integrase [Aeribacillus composti]|uniref:tyrosine-type recombinase/integrase n=1 Tax=Aeribacillus composti TaxID=1868734 RepID=UPI002E2293C5|nr:tyrosine-type recombinase/integrase [Aeribacillus composti]
MLEEFEKYIEGKSDNTIRTYLQRVEKFLNWLNERYGETDPAAITTLDVKKYQEHLTKEKSPATVSQYMFAIRKYCEFLNEKGYLQKDVSKEVKVKKHRKTTAPKVLDRNEFNRFRREVEKGNNPLHIAIIETLIATGMRVNELTSLTLDDIQLSERKGTVKIRDGKGNVSRTIPLNNDARKALLNYLVQRKETENNQLFVGQRGSMTDDGIRKLINRYANKAGISKKVTPHMFRHQLATELIRNKKKDLVLVKDILGHANINTLYVYSQSTEEEQAEALENLYE